MLKAEVDVVVKENKINPAWSKTVNSTLDAYLGKVPETFDYMGKQYNPKSFAQSLGLDMNNYVELT